MMGAPQGPGSRFRSGSRHHSVERPWRRQRKHSVNGNVRQAGSRAHARFMDVGAAKA
jgi:hypothetical protein